MAIPNLPTFVNGQAPPLDATNMNAIAAAVKDAPPVLMRLLRR